MTYSVYSCIYALGLLNHVLNQDILVFLSISKWNVNICIYIYNFIKIQTPISAKLSRHEFCMLNIK